jgi:hypothetical protein
MILLTQEENDLILDIISHFNEEDSDLTEIEYILSKIVLKAKLNKDHTITIQLSEK